MKAKKVPFYIRVRRKDGKDVFPGPVWNRNRAFLANSALIDGVPVPHPEGSYYLRYLRGGRRGWEAVGADAEAAVVAFHNKEHDLQSLALRRAAAPPETSVTHAPKAKSPPIPEATEEYLSRGSAFPGEEDDCPMRTYAWAICGAVRWQADTRDHAQRMKASGRFQRTNTRLARNRSLRPSGNFRTRPDSTSSSHFLSWKRSYQKVASSFSRWPSKMIAIPQSSSATSVRSSGRHVCAPSRRSVYCSLSTHPPQTPMP